MSAELEARYRRLLAWYPAAWRTANADALVGTLLDVAEGEGRERPTRQERRAIAEHGVGLRLDGLVVADVRNPASTVALTLGTGLALAEFLFSSWAPWITGNPAPGSTVQVGPFRDTGFVFAALWVIALVAALSGRWNVGRVVLLVSVLLGTVSPYLLNRYPGVWSVDRATLLLLSACAVVAVLGRPHRSQHTAAAAVGWFLLGALSYCSVSDPGQWQYSRSLWDGNLYAWYGTAVLEISAVVLAIMRWWRTAFTIVLSLVPYVGALAVNEVRAMDVGSGSVELVALPVALGLVLLVLHSRGSLALPPRRPVRPAR